MNPDFMEPVLKREKKTKKNKLVKKYDMVENDKCYREKLSN